MIHGRQNDATATSVVDDAARVEGSAEALVASLRSLGLNEIVIVDAACDRYADFVAAARAGEVGLHFCCDGRSAVRLARKFRADAWLVSVELADMSGFDLLEMLVPHVTHADVDPTHSEGSRSAIFMVGDEYRIEDEQQTLASGVAGYLVRPITLELVKATRQSSLLESVDA